MENIGYGLGVTPQPTLIIPKKLNTEANEIKLKATGKCARVVSKKPVPKNPVGKKAEEIWGGPGTTYVPRQDSDKSRTSNKTITRVYWKIY